MQNQKQKYEWILYLGIVVVLSALPTLAQSADKVVVIPLLGGGQAMGDATSDMVLESRTFSSIHGSNLTGAMPNIGTKSYYADSIDKPIDRGYHNGTGMIWGDPDLVAANIRNGKNIFGVNGDFTNDATATAADLPLGVSAYVKGEQLVGTTPLGNNVIGPPGAWYFTIPDGFYFGNKTVQLNITGSVRPEDVRDGALIFGVAGNFTRGATAQANDIVKGKTAYANGIQITGTLSVVSSGDDIIGPDGARIITIPDGTYGGGKTVTANDSDLLPGNIRLGVDIFGTVGTLSGQAVTTALRKTGQVECYDTGGNIISCAQTGQDGEFQYGVDSTPRFNDNGDGTVTDLLSGLMWLMDTDCNANAKQTWQAALNGILNLRGCHTSSHEDWRLPNLFELESLRDMGGFSPAFSSGHPFIELHPDRYWSSTTALHDHTNAWMVNFLDGDTQAMPKNTANAYAWYVRGGQ